MDHSDNQSEIERWTGCLAFLQAAEKDVRRKLKKLFDDVESRRCDVEIKWEPHKNIYETTFSRSGKILYVAESKKCARGHASVGIDSVDGKRPRVSWKDVDAGQPWKVTAIVADYFWERYISQPSMPNSNIVAMETYESLRRH